MDSVCCAGRICPLETLQGGIVGGLAHLLQSFAGDNVVLAIGLA